MRSKNAVISEFRPLHVVVVRPRGGVKEGEIVVRRYEVTKLACDRKVFRRRKIRAGIE